MSGTSWWQRLFGRKGTAADAAKADVTKGKPAPSGRGKSAARKPAERPAPRQTRPGKRAAVDAGRSVLGVVPAKGGWVTAHLDASGHGTPAVSQHASLAAAVEGTDATVVGIAIPLGLPDETRREADVQARKLLGAQGSAVFNAPLRDALEAETFGEANAISRERLGSGVSRQAYDLRRRILEVDAHLREDLPYEIVEVHPDVSLAELAGEPVPSRKKSAEGAAARRELLAGAGIHAPTSAPTGVATDEMLDACAAAWSAHRVKTGAARTVPESAQTFSDGVPAAVHV